MTISNYRERRYRKERGEGRARAAPSFLRVKDCLERILCVFYIGEGQAKEEGGLKTERFEKEHARAGAGLLYFLSVRVKQKENCVCVCLFYSRAKQGRRRLEGQ
jgi:hypothetical protein